MSIANFSISDAPIADSMKGAGGRKTPPKRQTAALADRKLAPEPR